MKESLGFQNKANINEIVGKKEPVKDFLKSLKDKISNGVEEFLLQIEDPDIAKFEKNLIKSIEISRAAGEYFKYLIPKSLKKPDKSYNPENREKRIFPGDIDLIEKLRKTKDEFTKYAYKEIKRSLLNLTKEDYAGRMIEKEKEGYKSQGRTFVYKRGETVLKEIVVNFLYDDSINSASSRLIFECENGKIDFNAFLPEGVVLMPGEMLKYTEEYDKESKELVAKRQKADLKGYKGLIGSSGIFAFWGGENYITYGDLFKKGNLLSLLHEIAHSWQDVYYEGSTAAASFKKFFKEVCEKISVIDYGMSLKEDEIDDLGEKIIRKTKEELLNLGVEVLWDDPRIYQKEIALGPGEYKIRDKSSAVISIIKSDKIDDLIKDYAREERDAWAHAIRILRFLRKRGINLEPEIKTAEDLKGYIDYYLSSYQDYLDDIIKFGNRNVRFVKTPKQEQ